MSGPALLSHLHNIMYVGVPMYLYLTVSMLFCLSPSFKLETGFANTIFSSTEEMLNLLVLVYACVQYHIIIIILNYI